jgi:flavin reductase (DIM6/NTAB) family NADH-FMN oxidoreductase RutF
MGCRGSDRLAKKLMTGMVDLIPMPITLVTVAGKNRVPDIVTVEWVSVSCYEPAYIGVSIEAGSYAHELLEENLEFVVNLVNEDLVHEAGFIRKTSGRNIDKFERARLTPQPAKTVKAPLVLEAPLSIECVVKEVLRLGTHDLYIGLAVASHVEESVLNAETTNIEKLRPITSSGGAYWSLGRQLFKLKKMIS